MKYLSNYCEIRKRYTALHKFPNITTQLNTNSNFQCNKAMNSFFDLTGKIFLQTLAILHRSIAKIWPYNMSRSTSVCSPKTLKGNHTISFIQRHLNFDKKHGLYCHKNEYLLATPLNIHSCLAYLNIHPHSGHVCLLLNINCLIIHIRTVHIQTGT